MLTVKQVKKSFDGVEILKGVDLSVEKGDVVAILGPSGAGKTTLLRCINFLEHADEGELIFEGEQRHRRRRSRRSGRRQHLFSRDLICLPIRLLWKM